MSASSAWRPGCIGSSLTYTPENEICAQCHFVDSCGTFVKRNTEIVAERLNADILADKMRLTTSSYDEMDTAVMMRSSVAKGAGMSAAQLVVMERVRARYSKSVRLAKYLMKNGIYLLDDLSVGENPYIGYKSHGYLHTVCELLLSGGFTKTSLRDALVSVFGWSSATANSTALVCIHALSEMGVIIEMSGNYVVGGKCDGFSL